MKTLLLLAWLSATFDEQSFGSRDSWVKKMKAQNITADDVKHFLQATEDIHTADEARFCALIERIMMRAAASEDSDKHVLARFSNDLTIRGQKCVRLRAQLSPGDVMALRDLAVNMVSNRQLDSAKNIYQRILEIDPQDVSSMRSLYDLNAPHSAFEDVAFERKIMKIVHQREKFHRASEEYINALKTADQVGEYNKELSTYWRTLKPCKSPEDSIPSDEHTSAAFIVRTLGDAVAGNAMRGDRNEIQRLLKIVRSCDWRDGTADTLQMTWHALPLPFDPKEDPRFKESDYPPEMQKKIKQLLDPKAPSRPAIQPDK